MIAAFKPCVEILPPAQQRLWTELRPAAGLGFALYGGTAIALRLGHRSSVDFDFFSEKTLAEARDYRDIAAMVSAGVNLSKGLSAARELFGTNFQPSESLKAMVYFDDGDLRTLTRDEKNCLIHAVSAVRDLPRVEVIARQLTAAP